MKRQVLVNMRSEDTHHSDIYIYIYTNTVLYIYICIYVYIYIFTFRYLYTYIDFSDTPHVGWDVGGTLKRPKKSHF